MWMSTCSACETFFPLKLTKTSIFARSPVFRTSLAMTISSLPVALRNSVIRMTSTWMKVVSVIYDCMSHWDYWTDTSQERCCLTRWGSLWNLMKPPFLAAQHNTELTKHMELILISSSSYKTAWGAVDPFKAVTLVTLCLTCRDLITLSLYDNFFHLLRYLLRLLLMKTRVSSWYILCYCYLWYGDCFTDLLHTEYRTCHCLHHYIVLFYLGFVCVWWLCWTLYKRWHQS